MDEYADINKFQPLSIYDTKSNNLTRLFSAKAEPNEVPKHINSHNLSIDVISMLIGVEMKI